MQRNVDWETVPDVSDDLLYASVTVNRHSVTSAKN